jgi:hypothetical protein
MWFDLVLGFSLQKSIKTESIQYKNTLSNRLTHNRKQHKHSHSQISRLMLLKQHNTNPLTVTLVSLPLSFSNAAFVFILCAINTTQTRYTAFVYFIVAILIFYAAPFSFFLLQYWSFMLMCS